MKKAMSGTCNRPSASDPPKRGHWSRQIECVLSCIGYSVGLGNIWRFPYLCMQNGGGAFLIPYFLCLFICGMPLFFMEMAIGQYVGSSPVGVFNLCPIFRGVGWGMLVVSGIMCIYYNVIMAWVLYYLGMSFQWELPWRRCDNSWNTRNCYSYYSIIESQKNASLYNLTTNSTQFSAFFKPDALNSSSLNMTDRRRSSTEEFWLYNTLEISPSISQLGGINWKLLICIAAAWILTFACLAKGIHSVGKVVYVTATAPYLFLTVILIRGVTLPGSWIGLQYYIVPKWDTLLSFQIWSTAAMQIFYSLGPAWGGIITMASYNKFHTNCHRYAVLIPIICCMTSFYGGFAIFSIIGHMAHISGEPNLDRVIQSGPGLAFVAYPEALAQLPGGAVWSVLFFVMLITVGLDSQFGTLETMLSGLADEFPKYVGRYKPWCTLGCCVFEFVLGLPLVTRAGAYIFQVIDWYSAAFSVMLLGLLECIVIAGIYDVRRLFQNIKEMVGSLPFAVKCWWALCWCVLCPITLMVVVASTCISFEQPKFDNKHRYPHWAIVMGWLMGMLSVIPVPIVMLYQIIVKRGKLKKLFRPDTEWFAQISKRKFEDETYTSHCDQVNTDMLLTSVNYK